MYLIREYSAHFFKQFQLKEIEYGAIFQGLPQHHREKDTLFPGKGTEYGTLFS
jgi:hypothetical protein